MNDPASTPSICASLKIVRGIRRLRQNAGMTRGTLADRAGIARSHMNKLDDYAESAHGAINIGADTAERIAEALGAKFTDLLT